MSVQVEEPSETARRGSVPSRARVVRVVVANDLRRLSRDRLALFFVAVLPFVLIVAIGSFIPSDDVDVILAVVDNDRTEASQRLLSALGDTDGFALRDGGDRREAERDVRIDEVSAAIVVPAGFAEALEAGGADVELLLEPTSSTSTLVRSAVSEAIDAQAARLTVERELEAAGSEGADELAGDVVDGLSPSEVDYRIVGAESGGSNYAFTAGGQMILFMFINSLTAGAGFIEMRRQGILGRAVAGPVSASDMLLGMGASRFLVASTLAVVITVMAVLAYGVDWGSLWVMGIVIVMFGIVSAAASTLIGALLSQPDAAVSVGVPLGIGMAALGGCMFPLVVAPTGMQVVAKILTPHAWAVDAILSSAYDGDGVADLWPNFAMLALWAVVLLSLAWVFAGRSVRAGSR